MSVPSLHGYSLVGITDGVGKTEEAAQRDLAGVTHFITTAQSTVDGDPAYLNYGEALKSSESVIWVGYMSTTGVYGNHDGATVDEDTPFNPSTRRGKKRVAAEQAWTAACPATLHVFRLPGIYGPGRGPLEKVRRGKASMVLKPGHRFNRIHVDDIVAALLASMQQPRRGGRVYNVVDSLPSESAVVNEFAYRLLGRTPPPRVPWEVASESMSAMTRSFYKDNKVCSNARLRNELGVVLRYPTYQEGLRATLREENAKWWADTLSVSGARWLLGWGWRAVYGAVTTVAIMPLSLVGTLFVWTRHLLFGAAPPPAPVCVLMDNGSVKAKSTLALRATAEALQAALGAGVEVLPVSMLHSDRVPSEQLDGSPARTLGPLLVRLAVAAGGRARAVVVVPYFFGPSNTVVKNVPRECRRVLASAPLLQVRVAPCLVHPSTSTASSTSPTDDRVAIMLVDRVRAAIKARDLLAPRVLVVDHGSPSLLVSQARNHVAGQVRALLGSAVVSVDEACMERRAGEEYDHAGALLQQHLDALGASSSVDSPVHVVVALLFLSPGRHAGEGGDIQQILDAASAKHPHVHTHTTALLGSHPSLVELLADRYHTAVAQGTAIAATVAIAAPRCPMRL